MPQTPYIVAVAGGSGSGKSTIIKLLLEKIKAQAAIFSLDDYYIDRSHLPPKERERINFDHPDALEWDLIFDHIAALKSMKPFLKPIYDFNSHTQIESQENFKSSPVVILDGIFALLYKKVRLHCDLKIFVDVPPDIRFIRRMQRDLEQRGRSMQSIIDQYQLFVRPMHLEFVEPSKAHADFIVEWSTYNHDLLSKIANIVNNELAANTFRTS